MSSVQRAAYFDGALDTVAEILKEHSEAIAARLEVMQIRLDRVKADKSETDENIGRRITAVADVVDEQLKAIREDAEVRAAVIEAMEETIADAVERMGEAIAGLPTAIRGDPGTDGVSWQPFGGWKAEPYPPFSVVCWNGCSWVSSDFAEAGDEPGKGGLWKLLAMRGKAGQRGERGGQGGRGPEGPAGPAIVEVRITDEQLIAVRADGVVLTSAFPVRALMREMVREVMKESWVGEWIKTEGSE
jgi:hypothetical protein